MTEPIVLNERQLVVLAILAEYGGSSGMDAASVGQKLMELGHVDEDWGRIGTQAGGRGQALSRSSGGAKKATRSAQKTLRTLREGGYVTASQGSTMRYRLTEKGHERR